MYVLLWWLWDVVEEEKRSTVLCRDVGDVCVVVCVLFVLVLVHTFVCV